MTDPAITITEPPVTAVVPCRFGNHFQPARPAVRSITMPLVSGRSAQCNNNAFDTPTFGAPSSEPATKVAGCCGNDKAAVVTLGYGGVVFLSCVASPMALVLFAVVGAAAVTGSALTAVSFAATGIECETSDVAGAEGPAPAPEDVRDSDLVAYVLSSDDPSEGVTEGVN